MTTIHYSYDSLKNGGNILFEGIVGSQSYGTNLPTSDIDKKFVYMANLEDVLTNSYPVQINVDDSDDFVGYEIGRVLELLEKSGPNIIELLHLPKDCIISCHPLFKKYIIDRSNIFLTKQTRFSFGNYAATQIKKARGTNKKIVNPMPGPRKGLLDFCYITHKQGSIPLKDWLDKVFVKPEMCGVVAIDHMKNCFNLFIDYTYVDAFSNLSLSLSPGEDGYEEQLREIHSKRLYKGITDKDDVQIVLSSVEKGLDSEIMFYCNIEGFSHYCKEKTSYDTWIKERNPERFVDNAAVDFNYDTKNMLHCHRLLDMAIEILRDKKVIVRRPNREQLLTIRAGKYPYDQLIKEAEEKVKLMEELYITSDLPEKLDKEVVFDLLYNFRKEFYNL